MQFQIKNVVFADSFKFLSASLDTLVATLRKSSKENYVETRKYMGNNDIVFEKRALPIHLLRLFGHTERDCPAPEKRIL